MQVSLSSEYVDSGRARYGFARYVELQSKEIGESLRGISIELTI